MTGHVNNFKPNHPILNPTTCIIADSTSFIKELYQIIFKNSEICIVAEASDGVEALIQLAQHKPDLLILDIVLPLKNGFDVLKELEKVSAKTKVIVISSLDEVEYKNKCLSLGAISFLSKPFTKSKLLDAVIDVVHHYKEVHYG